MRLRRNTIRYKFKSEKIFQFQVSGLARRNARKLNLPKISGVVNTADFNILSVDFHTKSAKLEHKDSGVLFSIWNEWIVDVQINQNLDHYHND